jgi:hypothetical protein
MTAKETAVAIIGGLILIALGVAMIVNPDLAEGAKIPHRHALLQTILVRMWGVPGGIITILLGIAGIWRGIKAIIAGAKTPHAGRSQ